MEKIAYFDYCALIMFGIVLMATVMRKMTRGRLNRFFLSMIFLCIFTTIADMCAVYLDNQGSGYVLGKHIAHTSYLFLHSLITPVYIIYLAVQTDTVHKLRKSRVQQVILVAPILIVTLLLVINCFSPIVYYLNEQDDYTRGKAFFVLYAVAVVYIILGIYYVYQYRRSFNIGRFVALISLFPLMMIATVVQLLFKNLIVEMFANACGVLLITMMIQRAEERIDSEIGLQKLSAYMSDLKLAFINEKIFRIIMINIVNYKSLEEMLGYDTIIDVKKSLPIK